MPSGLLCYDAAKISKKILSVDGVAGIQESKFTSRKRLKSAMRPRRFWVGF